MEERNDIPKLSPVVTGETKAKKRNFFEKAGDELIAQKDGSVVRGYLFKDVFVPTFKRLIFELITGAVDMILYGGNAPSMKSQGTSNPYVSYNSRYSSRPVSKPNTVSGVDVFSFEKIMFTSKADALAVLDQMFELLSRYHLVTVAQFYDLSNFITDNPQATKFGWMDLSGAEVVSDYGGGYFIKLPKSYPID